MPINVDEYNIDMLSASGHKLNGPKGIGFLYIRTGVKIRSFIHGGAQESKAPCRNGECARHRGLWQGGGDCHGYHGRTDAEGDGAAGLSDGAGYEGGSLYPAQRHPVTDRLPNNANFAFQFIEGESLLIMLDMAGICGSSGSACTSGSLDPSHVLLAIGLPHEIAHGSLRLTLSEENTKEEMDYTVEQIKEIVAYLRSMSPLYEDYMKAQGSGTE